MSLKNYTFLRLRSLGYSPREALRILNVARHSRLEWEESINLCLECHGKGPIFYVPQDCLA